jgi:hypothetical protein
MNSGCSSHDEEERGKEEKVAWRGGLGRDEVVRPVARKASAKGMVAGFG